MVQPEHKVLYQLVSILLLSSPKKLNYFMTKLE